MEVDPPTCAGNASSASSSSPSNPTAGTSKDIPEETDEFLSTGRVGRRNAVPDINADGSAKLSTADLPMELEKLSCSDNTKAGEGCSKDSSSDNMMETSSGPGTSGQQQQ